MNIFTYSIFAYALMAVISLAVVGVIVLINHFINKPGKEAADDD